ncbi:MAG: hypothetical protein XD95_0653 [Microgenomates bacterium 39_7]|nr:MAG: hypothetical protein XD95_0653 [Microgenomates bacterium 39_7]
MIQINFLSKQNKKLSKQQEKDKLIFKYALIAFIICSVAFLGVFSINLYLQYKINQVQAQTTTARKQIDSERTLEANYLFFVNKLAIIRELFDQRANKQIAMGFFSELFGPNIAISGLTYNMEDGILSLQVTSPHVFYLEEALEVLEDPEVTKYFSSLTKSNLNRQAMGQYTFSLTVSFSEDSELVIVETEY